MRFSLPLFLAGLLFVCNQAAAIQINPYLSGSWYDPDHPGHGFSIEVASDGLSVFYWYVYNPDGTPTFLIGAGQNVGDTIQATAYYNTGMVWGVFDPATRTETIWGTLNITFHDCNSATLSYNSTHGLPGIPSGSGQIPLTRLVSIKQGQCGENPYAGIYEGGSGGPGPQDPSHETFMLLTPDWHFVAFSYAGEFAVGDYTASNRDFAATGILATVTGNGEDWIVGDLEISGRIVADHRVVLDFTADGVYARWADLYALHEMYRRGVTMAVLAGDWTMLELPTGHNAGFVTIAPGGKLTGGDSEGCVYSGQASIPDPQFNLFEISVTVSTCADISGTFTGYGYQIDLPNLGKGANARIVLTGENGAGAFDLRR